MGFPDHLGGLQLPIRWCTRHLEVVTMMADIVESEQPADIGAELHTVIIQHTIPGHHTEANFHTEAIKQIFVTEVTMVNTFAVEPVGIKEAVGIADDHITTTRAIVAYNLVVYYSTVAVTVEGKLEDNLVATKN